MPESDAVRDVADELGSGTREQPGPIHVQRRGLAGNRADRRRRHRQGPVRVDDRPVEVDAVGRRAAHGVDSRARSPHTDRRWSGSFTRELHLHLLRGRARRRCCPPVSRRSPGNRTRRGPGRGPAGPCTGRTGRTRATLLPAGHRRGRRAPRPCHPVEPERVERVIGHLERRDERGLEAMRTGKVVAGEAERARRRPCCRTRRCPLMSSGAITAVRVDRERAADVVPPAVVPRDPSESPFTRGRTVIGDGHLEALGLPGLSVDSLGEIVTL